MSQAKDPYKKQASMYQPNRQPMLDDYGFEDDQRRLVCSIRVDIDGGRSEFLNVLEGDDPAAVVRKFSRKFNLTH